MSKDQTNTYVCVIKYLHSEQKAIFSPLHAYQKTQPLIPMCSTNSVKMSRVPTIHYIYIYKEREGVFAKKKIGYVKDDAES